MKALSKANLILNRGGIVAHATDTCYGFACDISNKKALDRLYRLKKMKKSKPVSIMVTSLEEAGKYGYFSTKAKRLAKKYWPGPLTLIVKRRKTLPALLNPQSKTIGIRVPHHKLSLSLVKKAERPLATTSANISGLPPPYSASEMKKQFEKEKLKPDLIINSGKIPKNPPSTIIDVSGGKMKVIRKGSIYVTITRNK